MIFEVHNMADMLDKRERRLQQLKERANKLEHKANRAERYLRLFGECIGYNRRYAIRRHINDLLKAYREVIEDYNEAIDAPLSTFADNE